MGNYGIDPSWGKEQQRLALIEKCYDPMTIARLTELGVAEGWRCLEIGAGGGSIARWLRDRVGPEGRVVAIDLDTRLFANEPGIEARQADIMPPGSRRAPPRGAVCLPSGRSGRQLDRLRRSRDLAQHTWRHVQHYADAKTNIIQEILKSVTPVY